MARENDEVQVEGPVTDQATGHQAYTVSRGGHSVRLSVYQVIENGADTWNVSIEGVPDPGIIHDDPWTSAEMARDAGLRAARAMLDIAQTSERELPLDTDEDTVSMDEEGRIG